VEGWGAEGVGGVRREVRMGSVLFLLVFKLCLFLFFSA